MYTASARILRAQLVLAACGASIWPLPCSETQPSLLFPSCPSAFLPGDSTLLGALLHPSSRLPTGQHVVSALLSMTIEWVGQVLACADPSAFLWESGAS